MTLVSALAVFLGAGLGALLRWSMGTALNPIFPTLPLGTLAANLLGGVLIGSAARQVIAYAPCAVMVVR